MVAQEYSRYREASEEEVSKLQDTIKEIQTKNRDMEQSLLRQLDQANLAVEELQREKLMFQEEFSYREGQLKEELKRVQTQQEEDRAIFLRKVDSITHEMSRKEKELLQLNARRDHFESLLRQKDQQLQDLQKEFAEETQHLTQRADDFRAKYAAMKDEHMELKI